LLILCSILVLWGCGNKIWPEPSGEDRIVIGRAASTRTGDCIQGAIVVDRGFDEIGSIVLFMDEQDAPCPTCIFRGETRVEYLMDDDVLTIVDDTINLDYCGLSPQGYYRWRFGLVPDEGNREPTMSRIFTQ
jgi:hypothetical protein